MRPAILFPLFAATTTLPGVGARMAQLLEKTCGTQVVDLLWHLPTGLIDRSYRPSIAAVESGRVATLAVRVAEHAAPTSPRLPYRIIVYDDSGQITLSFFNGQSKYLTPQYPTNVDLVISGRVEFYRHELQMPHPDYVVPAADIAKIPLYEPIYGLTEGISSRQMRRFAEGAHTKLPTLPEWIDPHLFAQRQWPDWPTALHHAHHPQTLSDLSPLHPARQRLAYDELLANQIAMRIFRNHHRGRAGRSLTGDGRLTTALKQSLPFQLTEAQQRSMNEIAADMAAPQLMLRLLQGDVGSGKTIVALLAMLQAVEAGTQAALLAPTELLAKQHYAKLNSFLQPLGITIGLLIGKASSKDKKAVTTALADGTLRLVVGTHAIIQDAVEFQDLGLAVIDEQHRFGVQQRVRLADKGHGVDILAMTATPIPRTLTLTAYGDMEVSLLDGKPPGRQPIDTRVLDLGKYDKVVAGLQRRLAQGGQAYWVCPLVTESELSDLANATDRAAQLSEILGVDQVGLIHGQMPPAARDPIMARFVAGELRVLVATTVIEVGVDVPNATLMIIEHAERFGLAQLHQLRGRVGRGGDKSVCLLLYQSPLGEMATARLKLLRETEDGFRVAEEDLRLRGPGEMLGTKQSGATEYRLADLSVHQDLLTIAREDAKLILHQDANLATPRGQALRTLLYLFAYDQAALLLRGG
jgi:ATP-dependent DNA helicase RecG